MNAISEDPGEAVEANDEPVLGLPEAQADRGKSPWKKIGLVAGGALLTVAAMVAIALRAATKETALRRPEHLGHVDRLDGDDGFDDTWADEDDYSGFSDCSTCEGVWLVQYCPECHRVDLDA